MTDLVPIEEQIDYFTENLISTFCPEAAKTKFSYLTPEIFWSISNAAKDSFVDNFIWDGLKPLPLREFSPDDKAELVFWQLVMNHANAIHRWNALCHIAAIVRGCSFDDVRGPFKECDLVDNAFMCLSFASNRSGKSKIPAKDYLSVVIPCLIGIPHGTKQGKVKLALLIPALNKTNKLLKSLIPKAHEFLREYDGEISILMLISPSYSRKNS